jgi:serine/threonine/tyrosine-interacting protein
MNHIKVTNPGRDVPPGKVLVFCESGNEKSAAVVAAWIMSSFEGVSGFQAMRICHTKRFCCSLDDVLKEVLVNYWDIIQATRQVNGARAGTFLGPASGPSAGPKRRREVDDDEMMTDEQSAMDEERFEGRKFSPFK